MLHLMLLESKIASSTSTDGKHSPVSSTQGTGRFKDLESPLISVMIKSYYAQFLNCKTFSLENQFSSTAWLLCQQSCNHISVSALACAQRLERMKSKDLWGGGKNWHGKVNRHCLPEIYPRHCSHIGVQFFGHNWEVVKTFVFLK